MRSASAPAVARTTATIALAASGSGLLLLLAPWPYARYAGAALGVLGSTAAAWVTWQAGRPAAPNARHSVETVAQTAPLEPNRTPPIDPAMWDEVGALERDRTVAAVARQEVATLLGDVNTNAAELLRAATSVRTIMEQLERSVSFIANGSRDQTGRLSTAAGLSEESAQSVTRIAGEATHMAAVVRETATAARNGAVLLEEAAGVVGALGAVVQESNGAMERLDRLSGEVGKLVDGIGSLSKQSNLLALNAAIEAARAGAHGKSFSVVAEAMRDLANQAAASSAEAGHLVSEVQAETHKAIQSVTAGGSQVAEGTRLMGRVVTDLRGILERTAGIEGGMVNISEHATVAEEAARKLADQIAAVAAVSAQATAEAERMAENSREAATSIKAIAHVSRHYAQVPEAVRASLVPVERAVAGASALVDRLEPLAPARTAVGATGEVKYADWQPWENCRIWWRLDPFMAAHPEIHIKHLHLQSAEFCHQLSLPETPDVTWAAPDWAPQLLQPIDDLIERDRFDLSSFVPGVVDSLRRLGGGHIYGLPMHLNMPLMVYNKSLFERVGVPCPRPGITWEELLPQLERIKAATGVPGIEIDMRNAHFLPFVLHFLAPVGAPLMDDAGTKVNGSSAVLEKLRLLQDLGSRGLLLPYEQLWAPERPFVKGQAAVLIGSTATLLFTPIREMAAKGQLNFVPEVTAHPTFASHPNVAPAPNFHLIGLHRFAQDRNAGFALLKHLVTDRERMRGDILRWGQAPAQYNEQVKAAYAELGRQGAPTQYHTIWSVQTAPMPQYILTPGFRRLETVAGHEMALLMAGQKSPAELIASLQKALSRHA